MLTLLVHAPDTDQLRQLVGDLPALEAAAERTGCAVVLIDGDRISVSTGGEGG